MCTELCVICKYYLRRDIFQGVFNPFLDCSNVHIVILHGSCIISLESSNRSCSCLMTRISSIMKAQITHAPSYIPDWPKNKSNMAAFHHHHNSEQFQSSPKILHRITGPLADCSHQTFTESGGRRSSVDDGHINRTLWRTTLRFTW